MTPHPDMPHNRYLLPIPRTYVLSTLTHMLYHLLQCLHHIHTLTHSRNTGTHPPVFRQKLTELDRFVRPALDRPPSTFRPRFRDLTITYINSTLELLVTHYHDCLHRITCDLYNLPLTTQLLQEAMVTARRWAHHNYGRSLHPCTLSRFTHTLMQAFPHLMQTHINHPTHPPPPPPCPRGATLSIFAKIATTLSNNKNHRWPCFKII